MHMTIEQTAIEPTQYINVDDPDAVWQWAKAFAVSPDQIRIAVSKTGPRASDVRDYLRFHGAGLPSVRRL